MISEASSKRAEILEEVVLGLDRIMGRGCDQGNTEFPRDSTQAMWSQRIASKKNHAPAALFGGGSHEFGVGNRATLPTQQLHILRRLIGEARGQRRVEEQSQVNQPSAAVAQQPRCRRMRRLLAPGRWLQSLGAHGWRRCSLGPWR